MAQCVSRAYVHILLSLTSRPARVRRLPRRLPEILESGDSSELAPRLPCKGKSVRNRGVSQIMPFLVIPRSLLRGGFIVLGEFDLRVILWFVAQHFTGIG